MAIPLIDNKNALTRVLMEVVKKFVTTRLERAQIDGPLAIASNNFLEL